MNSDNIPENKDKGMIIEIQRWSVSDGPGTRTVIFLKGCPLKCAWCANPESHDRRPQIGIFSSRCVDCRACSRECPENIAIPAKKGAFSGTGCTQCGKCIATCHADARTWMGEEMSVNQVIEIIKKDKVFYRNSFGGVTFSGGEPLTQPAFLKQILGKCQTLGIHTAVETCGAFNWDAAADAVGLLDFVMFDLKHMDGDRHKELTGSSNRLILENAKKIAGLGVPMLVRIPVIPTLNDSPENIRATARFVRDSLPGSTGIEMLPYHQLGLVKYAALGLEYQLQHLSPPSESHMQHLRNIITAEGVACITADTAWTSDATHPDSKGVA